MHLHLRAAEDKHGDSVSALCWRGLRRSSSTFGYAAWAGMACSGGSTASRGWWRGRGVTAAAVALGGGVRSGLWAAATSMAAVLGSRGGGSRTAAAPGADEKPSVRGRAKEEGNIWGGLLSRVKPPPGIKGPFVPGRGSTRDKRCFWAGRENSQPAAHL